MTVKQLIEALSLMPQDAEVITEGCDCYGDISEVKLAKDMPFVNSMEICLKENKVYLCRP